jgi:hypothetical protein
VEGTVEFEDYERIRGSSDRKEGSIDGDCGSAHYAGVWPHSFRNGHIGYRHS